MGDSKILSVWAREVLDSRGNPTIEAEVRTSVATVTAIAPSGASTGSHEALELRDGGSRYSGKGVLKAVENVRKLIAPRLQGMDATNLSELDAAMIELDGTENKSRLGANATTAVSLACAKAGAAVREVPLYEHLSRGSRVLPVPMMNILNGGKHAGSKLKIQEFMIVPSGEAFSDSLRMGAEVYQSLKKMLKSKYGVAAVNIGDEGGFAPPVGTTEEALEVIAKAIDEAGYAPGKDVFLAIDAAASEFYSNGRYNVDERALSPGELIDFYSGLVSTYPIISIEDPVQEEAFETMAEMTRKMGRTVQLIGDDIFVTNVKRIKRAIEERAGNATLLKVNQIGTLTEAIEAAHLSFSSGYRVVVSHRSGETEDTSIADLAVSLECGQIKTGAPARGERTAKYNRLLRIEEELGDRAAFLGTSVIMKG